MPVPTSFTSLPLRHFICQAASEFPHFAWNALILHEVNANVILPVLQKCLKQEQGGTTVRDHLWMVIYTESTYNGYDVKLILSCTDSLTGKYPLFLFTPTRYSDIPNEGDVTYRALQLAASQLCHALSNQLRRVYSVFGPEILCRTFATLWSSITNIAIVPDPYYDSMISYVTRKTLTDETSALPQQSEMRSAEIRDLDVVAHLCYEFARAAEPFTLTQERAHAEAQKLIDNHLVWVHTSGPDQIVSIVAFTRISDRVATITKVFTDPKRRGKKYAERLVRRVCTYLLYDLKKDYVALYVGRDNRAANVYGYVGFLGIGKGAVHPVEGVDPWVEFGFDLKDVELGHW